MLFSSCNIFVRLKWSCELTDINAVNSKSEVFNIFFVLGQCPNSVHAQILDTARVMLRHMDQVIHQTMPPSRTHLWSTLSGCRGHTMGHLSFLRPATKFPSFHQLQLIPHHKTLASTTSAKQPILHPRMLLLTDRNL